MIDKIKQALSEATPGPWDFAVFEDSRHVIYDNTMLSRHIAEIVRGGVESEEREEANAHLIANAPEWLAWAVGEIERLQGAMAGAAHIANLTQMDLRELRQENERYREALGKIASGSITIADSMGAILSANRALEGAKHETES